MSAPRPSEADVEALADLLARADGAVQDYDGDWSHLARAVLDSDWLVDHDAARDAEHEREVEALRAIGDQIADVAERNEIRAVAAERDRDEWARKAEQRLQAEVEARRALADLRGEIKAVLAGWDEAPSILSGVDEWTKGWLRCLEQAATEIRALLPRDDAAGAGGGA